MMKAFARGLLLLLAGASSYQVATPVDRVISLLTKLSAQVQAEGAAEAASYDKYACFCKDKADNKVYVIAKSDKKIKSLEADITALEGEITSLDSDVTEAKGTVEKEEGTQKTEREGRNTDQETYAGKRKSLVEAVEAVQGALEAMRNSRDDVSKQMSLVVKKLPPQSPALALITAATAGKRSGKPGEATKYQYASKEVIATLTSLTMTFKKELAELDASEMNAVGDFEMAYGARANTITAIQKEVNEKETLSASKGETKAEKEEQKNGETTARNADQGFLDDLTVKCESKAKAWDERSTSRASELTALTQAVELLKGMGNLYDTNSKLVGLIAKNTQPTIAQHKPSMFLQLQSVHQTVDEQKFQELTSHLNKEARSLNSAPLAMLALRLRAAGPDHFKKVRDLIKDLIGKLEDDAASEATAKTACDKNMKTAVEKRDQNAAKLETAGAEIDTTKASINTLKNDIVSLGAEIADLHKQLNEMLELRANEKLENEKTIENAKSGKEAVDSAIEIIKKFYEGSFVQQPKKNRGEDI
jgi:uncharacterized coiled-coil DUF342 family protein